MGRLRYLARSDIDNLVDSLTRGAVVGATAFRLAGPAGAERLESALAQPRWPQYRTLQHKAATLHYSLTKDHPCVDGNKRLAVTAMEYFLFLNGAVVVASNDEVVRFALDVARGAMTRDQSQQWVQHRTLRLRWSEEQFERWRAALPEEHARGVNEVLAGGDVGRLVTIALTYLAMSLDKVADWVQSLGRTESLDDWGFSPPSVSRTTRNSEEEGPWRASP